MTVSANHLRTKHPGTANDRHTGEAPLCGSRCTVSKEIIGQKIEKKKKKDIISLCSFGAQLRQSSKELLYIDRDKKLL